MENEGNSARAQIGEVTMVEPLRRRRADGTAYYRRPGVEAELQQLAKLTPAEELHPRCATDLTRRRLPVNRENAGEWPGPLAYADARRDRGSAPASPAAGRARPG